MGWVLVGGGVVAWVLEESGVVAWVYWRRVELWPGCWRWAES